MERKKLTPTVESAVKIAESLGFEYRASSDAGTKKEWVTFTYPGTNTYVIHVNLADTENVTLFLANELVRCGRIQQRQAFLREWSPFNYN